MRVAIVTESFLPQVNGVTNSVLRVVEYLTARGDDVLVVAPGAGPEEYCGAPVVRVPAVDLPVVNTLPVGVPTRTVLTALAAFGPDVVHLASPFVVGARGLAAARRLGVPTVAVYQTDIPGFAEAYGLGLGARAAWRWVRRLHSRADRTLAPSSDSAHQLRLHGVPRVHRWGRGVDVERFDPAHGDPGLRAELAPGGELLVGFVGRLAPEKEVGRLTALADVPGVRVVIVGDGPEHESLREALPDAAFLGVRYGDELARIYASLDVFVHTGPHETFCQTVQEAMASGLPVIAPAAGGPRDLVDHGRTGYLLPPDHGAFTRVLPGAIDDLRDRRQRTRLGEAGRAAVLGRTWPAVCRKLTGHYDAVRGQILRAA
ncbi:MULTISPECIES: glycosyltransferase family 4 protein [Prauserella salsuginis group]|uniref:Phosphatidylinositol alpha 1,6-mannosyltransferase n=2 Tax=Prauserella salsuginis group TaxID=2893672 RepID=A0A839XL56_9PSEU|nr:MULTISPECIES: glycosyltransferase family 1 protein [Prauserella salsuginis group]MBB3662264.1 phosphatidylinositol alpha 1,6-mannosyltransferase [Prauserella sediminis]